MTSKPQKTEHNNTSKDTQPASDPGVLFKGPGILLKDPGVLLKDPGALLKGPEAYENR